MNIEVFSELLEEAATISGTFYRAVTADRAKQNSVLSMHGSYVTGGRFNIAGEFGALYVSAEWETAIKEAINTGCRAGFTKLKPKTLVAVEVESLTILNLEDSRVIKKLGIRACDLEGAWLDKNRNGEITVTQSMASFAREMGFEGIQMGSLIVPGSINLAIFLDRTPESKVKVIHKERLPT